MRRFAMLLRAQAIELARFADEQVARVVAALTERAALLARSLEVVVGEDNLATARLVLQQAIVAARALRENLSLLFADAEARAQSLVVAHLSELLRLVEPAFVRISAALGLSLPARLAQLRDLGLHQSAVERFAAQVADTVQHQLVAAVASGKTAAEVAKVAEAAMASTAPRAAVLTRTEANRAYNDAHLESLRELDRVDPRPSDPLFKRIEEYFDNRNHPFSRVADGQTVPVDEPFRVSVAAVQAMAASMSKSGGGVIWPKEGGDYVGMNLPAHFNERGRIVAWRASWGP